ncbi:hypothetical protein MHYP_G00286510 [Metynnis hypsauchen]
MTGGSFLVINTEMQKVSSWTKVSYQHQTDQKQDGAGRSSPGCTGTCCAKTLAHISPRSNESASQPASQLTTPNISGTIQMTKYHDELEDNSDDGKTASLILRTASRRSKRTDSTCLGTVLMSPAGTSCQARAAGGDGSPITHTERQGLVDSCWPLRRVIFTRSSICHMGPLGCEEAQRSLRE